jgi:hypothetical protein
MDSLRDGIAVHGPALECVQNQEVESALKKVLALSHIVSSYPMTIYGIIGRTGINVNSNTIGL